MTACPVDAITISPVEAKLVIEDQCVGCKLCTIACPYGTIFYNVDTQKAVKCDLCGGDPAIAVMAPLSTKASPGASLSTPMVSRRPEWA